MLDRRLDLSAKFIAPKPAGLLRGRLLGVLAHRVGVVLAPAGHGKTTLLAQLASRFEGSVAWYRMDTGDRNSPDLPNRIGRMLLRLLDSGGMQRPFESFDQVAAALDAVSPGERVLLVLDDFHAIADSEAERGVARLITMLPPTLQVLLGARRVAGLDVEGLRMYGGVQLLDAEDLRFRSWEVERLFGEIYQQPLLPQDAATLTQRTEGWAAGLAMFHLLTAARPPAERRRALGNLSRGSRLVRSYLVREVLGELPAELRDFLRRTSALGVLTGELCDALLQTTGSQDVLEELVQRRLFITATPDGVQFGYHQVLLDHLELELTEQLGPVGTQTWYAHAAQLLLAAGEVPAAFRAYVRAENWAEVEQLLHARGAEVVSAPLGVVEGLLPVGLHSQDPWLLLARARRLTGHGALAEAVATFKLAESVAEDAELADRCAQEARTVAAWLPDAGPAGPGWTGTIRAATQRNPQQVLSAALALPGAEGRLAAGLVSLLGGDLVQGAALLEQARGHPDAGSEVVCVAACAAALLHRLGGTGGEVGVDLEALMMDAELLGRHSLARIGRALLDSETISPDEHGTDPDLWGRALVLFVDGLTRRSAPPLLAVAAAFARLDAPVLAQWATCLAEAAGGPAPTGRGHWHGRAGQRARALGLRQALPVIDRWAEGGSELPGQQAAGAPAPRTPAADVELRLFGGLQIEIDGERVDVARVRPRARSTLRLLALKAGSVVHREELAATLWPDADPDAALRSLQVAVSSLRSLLGNSLPLVRVGESYGISLPPGARCDLLEFESRLSAARLARLDGAGRAEQAHLRAALELYLGELLPEEGPAEWLLAARERFRLASASAAQTLADSQAEGGEPAEAIETLRICLRLDPYRDDAWRLLAELHRRTGNPAAATAARREHGQMLAELGLPAEA